MVFGFGRNGIRKAKKKAFASEVERGAKIKRAHQEEIARRKREAKEAKQVAKEQKAEEKRAKKLRILRQKSAITREEARGIEAGTRKREARREASPFRRLGVPSLGVKKKKQGGTVKKRKTIGL